MSPVMDWESRAEELETRWESEDGGRWRVAFQAVEIDGRLEPVGLDIRSYPRDRHAEPRRLLSRHLRELRIAELFMLACRAHAAGLQGDAELMRDTDIFIDSGTRLEDPAPQREPVMWDGQERIAEAAAREKRAVAARARGHEIGRGASFTSEEVKLAAKVYLRAWRDKRPPQKAVQEALGIPRRSQAGSLVKRCRTEGLLPKTTRGVARGWAPTQDEEEL